MREEISEEEEATRREIRVRKNNKMGDGKA